MNKRTTIILLLCLAGIAFIIIAKLFIAKSAIDKAVQLGELPYDTDTSFYLRVYEDSINRFYLNGHLSNFEDIEKRIKKLAPENGVLYYSNQKSNKNLPKDSKIFKLVKATQIGFVLFQDSTFQQRYD